MIDPINEQSSAPAEESEFFVQEQNPVPQEQASEKDTSVPVNTEPTDESAGVAPDYETLLKQDLADLKAEFPELKDLGDITELENPLRYGALRDIGLSAAEAYLASTRKRQIIDSRSHLSGAVPKGAASPSGAFMSQSELQSARELFSDLSDAEIHSLYRRIKKQERN